MPRDERGFALVVVVFLLFAVGISAATAYQVVFQESQISRFSADTDRARAIAEAGLRRYVGEAIRGPVADTAFFIDGGEAQVRARRIYRMDNWNAVFHLEATATVPDPRHFDAPAQRGATATATFRSPPVAQFANLVGTGTVNATNRPLGDAYGGSATGCDLNAAPWSPGDWRIQGTTVAALQMPPWSALTSAQYPVSHASTGNSSFPGSINFAAGYPVVRVSAGTLNANFGHRGRGVLVVSGNLRIGPGFYWEGLVLVGGNVTYGGSFFENILYGGFPVGVDGMVVAGMAGGSGNINLGTGTYRFHSCHVYQAGRSMGVFNLQAGSSFLGY